MATSIQIVPSNPGGAARWIQRTQLDGVDYLIAFDWNQRDTHWVVSVFDQDGLEIRVGMKLTTNTDLLRTCVDPRRPPGVLVVLDSENRDDVDPGFADLGTRFQLCYGATT